MRQVNRILSEPNATTYSHDGGRYYVCGAYKSMVYDGTDCTERMSAALKALFPQARSVDGGECNPCELEFKSGKWNRPEPKKAKRAA